MLSFFRNLTSRPMYLLFLFYIGLGGFSFPLRAEDLSRTADELEAKYAADIKRLASECEKEGLQEQARKTLAVLGPHDPSRFFVPVLPTDVGPATLPSDAKPEIVRWNTQLNKLRREQGESLLGLARRAIHTRQAALAIELLLASATADPDNEIARRLLRFQKYQNGWRRA
jgi:hypothetical protein